MSGPTKGMVAGMPINTGAQTKEFDEGYERTFGKDRKPIRGRTVYTSGGQPLPEPVEIDADWTGAEKRAQTPTEELAYGKLGRTTDGVDVSSRRKHREYLKATGFTVASDFSPEYQAREAASRERAEDRRTREAVERNVYKVFGD